MKYPKRYLLVILTIGAILFAGYRGLVLLIALFFTVPYLFSPVAWEQRHVYLRNRSSQALQVAYTVPRAALRFDITYQKVEATAVIIAVFEPVDWQPNSAYATHAWDKAFTKWQYQPPDSIRLTLLLNPGEELLLGSRRTQVSGGYPDRGRIKEMILSCVTVEWKDRLSQVHSRSLTPTKWLSQYEIGEGIGDVPNRVYYYDYR